MSQPGSEPVEYRTERLREAIATEADIHELGIVVHITGDHVLLSGAVASPAQRDAITALVQRLAPDFTVVNDVEVPSTDPPHEVENL